MKKIKLSALNLAKLPPGEYPDHIVSSLLFRVGKRRRTWTYRYRSGGKNPRAPLGHFPTIGLADAREAARKAAERIDAGTVPQPAPIHPRSPGALTLGALIDRYEATRRAEGGRVKSLDHAMHTLRQNLAAWETLPVAQFTKSDLREARDAVAKRGSLIAANRLLGYFGPVMRWAAQEDLVPVNFTGDVRRAPERKRSRVLTDKEILAIWRGCDKVGESTARRNFGRLIKFLLITAQRVGEGATIRHGDIVKGTWRQADNKPGRPHNLGLPKSALALIGQGKPDELIFAGDTGGRIGAISKLKTRLDEASGVTGWRLHDLRRSAATRMQELGIPNHIVQAVLNHAVPGVAGVYLRAELEQQKADALTAWAAALSRIVRPLRAVS